MFYERLKALCEENQTNLTSVLKDLGMSSGNLSKWKNGKLPKSGTVSALAEYFGVTSDYLLGLDGKGPAAGIDIPGKSALPLTAREERLVLKYRGLDEEGRTMVDSALISETRRMDGKKRGNADAG